MAERRMFTKKITDADEFISLPSSTQALYLHLTMSADDDGFNNQVTVAMFKAHASVQDLEALLKLRYVYQFENGVIVIKHWRMANALRKDRYTPTAFQKELKQLKIDEHGAYTFSDGCQVVAERLPDGCQVVADCLPQVRLGKDSIDKFSLSKEYHMSVQNRTDAQSGQKNEQKFDWLIEEWNSLKVFGITPITTIGARNSKRLTNVRARLKQYTQDEVMHAIDNIRKSDFLQGKHSGKPWQITFDWFVLPSNFPKVLEGNYTVSRTKSNTDLYNTFEENTYTDGELESLISN